MKGKLIVIEGSDGSGKATQLNLLKEYLVHEGKSVKTTDFPRYYDSFFGGMVARFLRGEFGKLKDVNPYLVSVLYAQDREQAKEDMEKWLTEGDIILSNRYAPSSLAHQSARLSPRQRTQYIEWELELEYSVNKIPKEDIVLYLHVPYKVSRKLIANKERKNREYTKGKHKDMVERNVEYLRKSEESYLRLVKMFPHWVRISCVDRKGNLKSREDIHEEIKKVLKKKGIV